MSKKDWTSYERFDSARHCQVAGRHPKSMPNMLCSSSVEIAMPWGGFDRVFVNLTVPVSGFMGPDSVTKMEISAESYRLGHGCLTSRAPR